MNYEFRFHTRSFYKTTHTEKSEKQMKMEGKEQKMLRDNPKEIKTNT